MSVDSKIYQFPVELVDDSSVEFAVIFAQYMDQWIFVKHKKRESFEVPGGRRNKNESITDCAKRELFEETGAVEYIIKPLEIFSIKHTDDSISYGQMFYAEITRTGCLPESEIGEVKMFSKLPENLTYPHIYSVLFERLLNDSETIQRLRKKQE